jgi:hypothetical protein
VGFRIGTALGLADAVSTPCVGVLQLPFRNGRQREGKPVFALNYSDMGQVLLRHASRAPIKARAGNGYAQSNGQGGPEVFAKVALCTAVRRAIFANRGKVKKPKFHAKTKRG